MQQFSVILESREQALEVVDLLWNRWGVRGEIGILPLDGHVKVDVVSEKDLTPQQLDKLPGKRA
ncbi:hypothetical protein TPY_1058 [Sulfobacillus acidophilus TPY]|jgi:hypothetical protein|uniref:Uncharacterized protein n=1 Tax=Sulfobacillus acidophilus (strain ATCC 700253 / DSM 10332 / NAL) TaxID=679936 RepID=G8TWR3_SULAD|nr:hypothetical protein TPY_1058 [Sulfobacillus acidophilus TPY]AEW06052.1 hypothetical protein Sulac_2590 [Sulfobacillus acidophilus DSM 10332]